MTVSTQHLQEWLTSKEHERLEFKEAKRNFHFEKLVKYCAALANEGGHWFPGSIKSIGPKNSKTEPKTGHKKTRRK